MHDVLSSPSSPCTASFWRTAEALRQDEPSSKFYGLSMEKTNNSFHATADCTTCRRSPIEETTWRHPSPRASRRRASGGCASRSFLQNDTLQRSEKHQPLERDNRRGLDTVETGDEICMIPVENFHPDQQAEISISSNQQHLPVVSYSRTSLLNYSGCWSIRSNNYESKWMAIDNSNQDILGHTTFLLQGAMTKETHGCPINNVVDDRSGLVNSRTAEFHHSSLKVNDEASAENRHSFPRATASFSPQNLGISDYLVFGDQTPIIPFSHPSFFNVLRHLPRLQFLHLARSVARFRRSSQENPTPSTVVSINLCGCISAHSGPVSGASLKDAFWVHEMPKGAAEPGVYDSFLSVMLVELHAGLVVVEFLDHRLPAIVRQRVGNRLDRNFVVQIGGISYTRSHLGTKWVMADLTECSPMDLKRLQSHPLYSHMISDLKLRSVCPVFRNLNLCPIQFCNNRAWPIASAIQSPTSSSSEVSSPHLHPTHSTVSVASLS